MTNTTPLAAAQKLARGVLILACNNLEVAQDALSAMIAQSIAAGSNTGLQLPKVSKVNLFIAGSPHQRRLNKARLDLTLDKVDIAKLETIPCGQHSTFDFLSNEGRELVLPRIVAADATQAPQLNIFMQAVSIKQITPIADAIAQYRRAAKRSKGYVVMVLFCKDGLDGHGLEELCDEFCTVDACEPDPAGEAAFSLEYFGLKSLNRYGIGKVMCNLRFSNQQLNYEYSPFIDDKLENRTIWLLRASGKTYDEIGKLMGFNKSTIMRRLDILPTVRSQTVDQAYLDELLERVELEDNSASQNDDDDFEADDDSEN